MRMQVNVATGILVSVCLALALAACGRYGPPTPPGPPSKVIYPKFYPQPTPQTP